VMSHRDRSARNKEKGNIRVLSFPRFHYRDRENGNWLGYRLDVRDGGWLQAGWREGPGSGSGNG
jgi:hypothetical protein